MLCASGPSARELAMEISVTSLGSSQTLRSPQLSTEAASRFCNLNDTMAARLFLMQEERLSPNVSAVLRLGLLETVAASMAQACANPRAVLDGPTATLGSKVPPTAVFAGQSASQQWHESLCYS